MTPPHDAFATSYKPVLHAMAGALSLTLAAGARHCEIALKAVNDSLADAAELEKEIDAAGDIPSLLEVQSKLARSWFERAAKNWTLLCEAAGENQLEMLRRGCNLLTHNDRHRFACESMTSHEQALRRD